MEYDQIITLVNEFKDVDEIGNVLSPFTTCKKIFAKKQSVKTNEFYSAVEVGLTPSAEFVVKRLNYHDEKLVIWNHTLFNVIRTVDPKNKYDIVLVCSKKIGNIVTNG